MKFQLPGCWTKKETEFETHSLLTKVSEFKALNTNNAEPISFEFLPKKKKKKKTLFLSLLFVSFFLYYLSLSLSLSLSIFFSLVFRFSF